MAVRVKKTTKKNTDNVNKTKMPRVLVDGAGGFLGSHTVEYLMEAGYRVAACGRATSNLSVAKQAGAEIVIADLTKPEDCRRAVVGCDIVVHVAALFDLLASYEAAYQANVMMTRNLCEAALEAGVKQYIQVSSVTVFGPPKKIPVQENDPKYPRNNYELTKQMAEEEARSFIPRGLPVKIVRPGSIYGPRSKYGIALLMAALAFMRDYGFRMTPRIKGGPRMGYVHARDVAQAIKLAIEKGVSGASYLCVDGYHPPIGEVIDICYRELGIHTIGALPYPDMLSRLILTRLAPISTFLIRQINRGYAWAWPYHYKKHGLAKDLAPELDLEFMRYLETDHVYDISALKALGFKPQYPTIHEGFPEAFRWYREHLWIK